MAENPLGKNIDFPRCYSPEILAAIPRVHNRRKLGLDAGKLPFGGVDVWNAYELSWLDLKGKPQAVTVRLVFPCDSTCVVESKSLKLYLGSFMGERYASREAVARVIRQDLSDLVGQEVMLKLYTLRDYQQFLPELPPGICLDGLDVEITAYMPDATLLAMEEDGGMETDETVFSELFKSNCPITGQPDWATVIVNYRGCRIAHKGLLRYLVSYREHSDYHENCVEMIFMDIQTQCRPVELTVEAHFLRRGGIDINPIRSTSKTVDELQFSRHFRQ